MTKPNFRPIQQPLAVPDAALDRLNDRMGVPTMSRPDILQTLPIANLRAPAPARALEKLSVELPTYLMDAMKQEALSRKVSVRHLVMIALKGQGLAIEPEDLVPDARRTAYKGRTSASS